MDKELKRHYSLMVDFLGHVLGPDYEIALHELTDASNRIVAIANGELTGRHLGSPLSNKLLEYVTVHLHETQDYVLRFPLTEEFVKTQAKCLLELVPYYIREGKYHLMIAVGCTGGQHRSVVVAEKLAQALDESDYNVILLHRELRNKNSGPYPGIL